MGDAAARPSIPWPSFSQNYQIVRLEENQITATSQSLVMQAYCSNMYIVSKLFVRPI